MKIKWPVMVSLVLLAWTVLFFMRLWPADTVLFATDNNIGQNALSQRQLVGGFSHSWYDNFLLGCGGFIPLSCTAWLNQVLPVVFFTNWIYALCLSGASLGLLLYLRQRKLAWPAIGLAMLAACWLSTNATVLYPGHTGKLGTLLFAMLALACLEKTARAGSVCWSILAGGCVGLAMVEQQDVALFFGLFWGAYAVFAIAREQGWRALRLAQLLTPMAATIVVIAGPPALGMYAAQTEGMVAGGGESAQAKWEFATQWSWPPEESVDFIAPGYTGWRSGEPDGTYWGRMGRSAGWEQSGQGFMNFKLDNEYLGIISFILALLAAGFAMQKISSAGTNHDDETPARQKIVIFWLVTAALTLLLAFGKFFPLYALFYQLPVVNNIRAPVKFLHVFQVALAILAAHGFSALIASRTSARA